VPLPSANLVVFNDPSKSYFRVEVDPTRVQGRRTSVGPIVEVAYEVLDRASDARTEPSLLALEGWLRLNRDQQEVGGIHIPLQVLHENHYYLRAPVTPAQLMGIEVGRNGQQVQFQLKLAGLANVPLGRESGTGQPLGLVTRPVNAQSEILITLHREQWADLLKMVGFGLNRLVELPSLQLPRGDDDWLQVIEKCDLATRQLHVYEPENAIATARKVVEGINTVIAAAWGIPRNGKDFDRWTRKVQGRLQGAWPQDPEAPELLMALLRAAWAWTSPTHHFGASVSIYQEASFALGLTSELVAFCSHLLTAHPQPVATSGGAGNQKAEESS
jgi:hypothetical protein